MTNNLSQNDTQPNYSSQQLVTRYSPPGFWYGLLQLSLSPTAWIAAFIILACLALLTPVHLPIGSHYWDVSQYPDAAWRIANGQIPHIDFSTPSGPLEYYSFSLLQSVFREGQILLLANWSIMLVALPLMALAIYHAGKPHRHIALALLLPFLVFAAFPLDTAGPNSSGIDNRHVYCIALRAGDYAFVCPPLRIPNSTDQHIDAGIVPYCDDRLCRRAWLDPLRFPRRYHSPPHTLVCVNNICVGPAGNRNIHWYRDRISCRYARPAEPEHADILHATGKFFAGNKTMSLAALGLALLLLWDGRKSIANVFSTHHRGGPWQRLTAVMNLEGLWVVIILTAAIALNSKTAGPQHFILFWPLAISFIYRRQAQLNWISVAVGALIPVMLVPASVASVNAMAQTTAASITYSSPQLPAVGSLGIVKAKRTVIGRAKALNARYAANPTRRFPGSHSKADSQLAWLMTISEAVQAVHTYEEKNNLRFNRLLTLDKVDPLAAIMGRSPVRHISIDRMEGRTLLLPNSKQLKAVKATDAVLVPRCPITQARRKLVKLFQPVLHGRIKRRLSACWDIYMHPTLIR